MMKQRQREQVQRGCAVGTVVLLAWLCRVLPLEGLPSGLQEACGILRSLLYLSLFAGWGISLYNRTVHPQVRRLLLNVDLLMLFWILVRTLRFQLNTPPGMDRMLGYLYYAPMLGIPVLCVQLVLTVDRSERYRLSAWARMLWLPSAVLLELVLTNDLHQQVFRLQQPWNENYQYGWLFGLVVGWIVICILLAFGIIAHKSRNPRILRRLPLPAIPLVLLGVYAVLYGLHIPLIKQFLGDMTIVHCLMTAASLEGGLRCGLIQSNTGYEELSLSSLSTSDHGQLEELLDDLNEWAPKEHVSLSLPSLRMDNFSQSLIEKTTKVRKSSLTFAAEAGTQRLRDVINKNVTWDEIEKTCSLAFANGYSSVKLYFMMGLPTETMEDIEGIAETAQKVVDLYYSNPRHAKGRGVQVTISCACFVPKPHTPFQFVPMDTEESLQAKQKHLLESVHSRKIKVNYHDSTTSFLEGVFAKGDRRLAPVILEAYKRGCYFDGWEECFKYDTWMQVFEDLGIDPKFYCQRPIGLDEVTPWSHMDYGVTHEYLVREYNKALAAQTTQPCNRACHGCGANHLLGGPCFDYSQNLV